MSNRSKLVWQRYQFKLNWHKDEVNWWVDLFIIDTLIRDIVKKFDIEYWRFHRRADRNLRISLYHGHRVSFYCYIDENKMKQVAEFIENHWCLKKLYKAELIDHHVCASELQNNKDVNVGSLCNDEWPVCLKDSWPIFMNGVCRMCLSMIESLRKRKIDKKTSVLKIEKEYRRIQKKFNKVFAETGSHAFFHHISSAFGYPQIEVKFYNIKSVKGSV